MCERQLGASSVCANEIDPLAVSACAYNAQFLNAADDSSTSSNNNTSDSRGRGRGRRRAFFLCANDLVGSVDAVAAEFDVVLAGDVCYDAGLATAVTEWLSSLARRGGWVGWCG